MCRDCTLPAWQEHFVFPRTRAPVFPAFPMPIVYPGCFPSPVVTLDGTLLAKNGCMTGGSSGGMEARSQQWDRREIESECDVLLVVNENMWTLCSTRCCVSFARLQQ